MNVAKIVNGLYDGDVLLKRLELQNTGSGPQTVAALEKWIQVEGVAKGLRGLRLRGNDEAKPGTSD